MADNLESPAPMPEKPFYQSQSFWAAAIGFFVGIAQMNDKLKPVADWIQINQAELVGFVVTALSLWGGYATLTRSTTLTKGK